MKTNNNTHIQKMGREYKTERKIKERIIFSKEGHYSFLKKLL